MKKSILIDFNNLAFRYFFLKEVDIYSPEPDFMIWKFMICEAIYKFMNIEDGINEVVIAVDDRNPWRKSYFPRYKESRKVKRKKQELNWAELYGEIGRLASDLRHYLPYKVLNIRSAEADDIIAVLAAEKKGTNIVISNDEDYLQLLKYNNVKIWHPKDKEYRVVDDPYEFVVKKCLMGQSKDDIFNIITPSDWGKTEETKDKKRKPGFGPAAYKKVMNEGLDHWLDNNTDASGGDLRENYHRNEVLMDFDYIPKTIINRIMNDYNGDRQPPPANIHKFFKKYRMRGFLEDFTNVERRLQRLY